MAHGRDPPAREQRARVEVGVILPCTESIWPHMRARKADWSDLREAMGVGE